MKYLHVGNHSLEVSPEIERKLPKLEQLARDEANRRGESGAHINFRTDKNVSGSLPLLDEIDVLALHGQVEGQSLGQVLDLFVEDFADRPRNQ